MRRGHLFSFPKKDRIKELDVASFFPLPPLAAPSSTLVVVGEETPFFFK